MPEGRGGRPILAAASSRGRSTRPSAISGQAVPSAMRLLVGSPLLAPPLYGIERYHLRASATSIQLCELCEPPAPPPLPRRLRRLAAYLRAADGERDRSARLIRLGQTMPLAPM